MLSCACFIKNIGRGKVGSRDLSREDARTLYSAMLNSQVSDLEMGAILLAMRIKGECVEEIAGFLDAAEETLMLLQAPLRKYAPIVIPSYNGSRRVPNLTPLLALLLARQGVPVLIHGIIHDKNRGMTSAQILEALKIKLSTNLEEAQVALHSSQPVFVPISVLAPKLARLLNTRELLGVRNSTHILVKIIQPFSNPVLRLISYTHIKYLHVLHQYFQNIAPTNHGDVCLMRGTEGEVVANLQCMRQIDWFHNNKCVVLTKKQNDLVQKKFLYPMNCTTIQHTICWIKAILDQKIEIPEAISVQVKHYLAIAKSINTEKI